VVKDAEQSGRWSDFGTGSSDLQKGEVFSLWIEHGENPKDASYAYTVLPGATGKALARYAAQPAARIVRNTPEVQAAVNDAARVLEAAFYQPGLVDGGCRWVVAADRPCLLLMREQPDGTVIVAVSNPENAALSVNITTDRKLSGEGATPAGSGTRLTFDLPGGDEAGSSLVRRFTPSPAGAK
jgi:hypothetical protein